MGNPNIILTPKEMIRKMHDIQTNMANAQQQNEVREA